jgi:hypothetical protein
MSPDYMGQAVNASQTSDLTADVTDAMRPLEPTPMPAVGPRLALRTSPALRRLVPARLAFARARISGTAAWSRTAEREHALATMHAIVGGTPRSGEARELAQERLVEENVQHELFWQPWPTASVDSNSHENRRKALSSGRPLLLSACHLGPYFLTMSAFASVGVSSIAVSAPWFFAEPSHDYWGRRLARWREGIRARGERLLCSQRAFQVVLALLAEGETVLNYFDMPGGTRTQFLGKPVMLTSGTARLAHMSDALVLPVRPRRDGQRVWADMFAPLDARDFPDWQSLHVALAQVHERSVLELAPTLEDPNRAGAWEQGATESGWVRPGTETHSSTAPTALGAA